MADPSFISRLGMSAASGAASSFGSAAGSGIGNALLGGISAKRQWKYVQKQMALQQQYALEQMAKSAEYQLKHDKSMFDYENAYNDPSKVFERFAKAGISPAAVLGQSGASVGATIGTGSGSAPSGASSRHTAGRYSGCPAGQCRRSILGCGRWWSESISRSLGTGWARGRGAIRSKDRRCKNL